MNNFKQKHVLESNQHSSGDLAVLVEARKKQSIKQERQSEENGKISHYTMDDEEAQPITMPLRDKKGSRWNFNGARGDSFLFPKGKQGNCGCKACVACLFFLVVVVVLVIVLIQRE